MAHTFKIYNATTAATSVDFTDSNHGIVAYNPSYAENGSPEITETAVIRVAAATDSGLAAALQTLTKALDQARDKFERNFNTLDYLYLGYNGITTGRSPLRRGSILALNDPMGPTWANREVDVTLSLTRSNYWESTGVVALTLTNLNASTGAATAKIFNNSDMDGTVPSEHINWVKCTPVGDLPAPAYIRIDPGSDPATGVEIKRVYVTQFSVHSGQSSTAYTGYGWLEGEDASTAAQSTAATASNGAYQAFAVSSGTTGASIEWDWPLTLDTDYCRILMGAKFNGTIRVTPYFSMGGAKTYGQTRIITDAGSVFSVFDAGMMVVPPPRPFTTQFDTAKFGLNVVCPAGITFNLDWVQVIPAHSMATAEPYEAYAYSTMTGLENYLVIESANDRNFTYVYNTDRGKISGKSAVQGGVLLEPGLTNWLMFNWVDTSYKNVAQTSAVVSMSYRPRWRYVHAS